MSPGGNLVYELFELTQLDEHGAKLVTPVQFVIDPAVNNQVTNQVKGALEKAIRVSNIQGYGQAKGLVTINAEHQVTTAIEEIIALPDLTTGAAIFDQALHNGYSPGALINQVNDLSCRQGKAKTIRDALSGDRCHRHTDVVLIMSDTQIVGIYF